MMNRTLGQFFVAVFIWMQMACSTTGLGRSWSPPDQGPVQFSRLAVVAMTQQEVYRIQAEDELVRELGSRSVASHTLIPGHTTLRDTMALVKALRQAQCDGVVTLQLTSGAVRPDVGATPAAASSSFNDHVDDYWVDPSEQRPESFAPGQYYSVEVHLFDLRSGRMIWNGLAIEKNATDAADLVRKVRKSVRADLLDRGLVSAE